MPRIDDNDPVRSPREAGKDEEHKNTTREHHRDQSLAGPLNSTGKNRAPPLGKIGF
jgi:hypothetical protein